MGNVNKPKHSEKELDPETLIYLEKITGISKNEIGEHLHFYSLKSLLASYKPHFYYYFNL